MICACTAVRAVVTLAMAVAMAVTSVASEVFSAAVQEVTVELEIFLALVVMSELSGVLLESVETRM